METRRRHHQKKEMEEYGSRDLGHRVCADAGFWLDERLEDTLDLTLMPCTRSSSSNLESLLRTHRIPITMPCAKNNQKDAPPGQQRSLGMGSGQTGRDGARETTTEVTDDRDTVENKKPLTAQDVQAMRKRAEITMKEVAPLLKKVDVTGAWTKVADEETMARSGGFTVTKEEVGRGSRAVIYKALDAANKEIACKVTAVKDLKGAGKSRYQDSLKVLRFLINEPDVNLLDTAAIFSTPDKIYVFCPLMTIDLAHRLALNTAVMTEQESLRTGRQVAQGIAFLHSLGVAHERIRPGHILFNHQGVAKIGGLGWLVPFYDLETDAHVRITGSTKTQFQPFYAPEVLKNDPYDPSVADIWSLGTTIVVMQTKEWPFEKDMPHRHEVALRVTYMKAGLKLSPVTLQILQLCFDIEPEKRGDIFDVLAAFPSSVSAS